ncbi:MULTISPECIES: hypothetical protein [Enterococcus]|uniref:hypothetical protein n=1 Tax=Enterococcus TaxID=1350 RepID=UPI0010F91099|nr:MULTISPECIES: hypothetical protein [Enterococcus]MBX8937679.1 hypothetical protein [Enterococcus gilvus]
MSRKKERTLIKIMGIWQIIDGLITIMFYGIYQEFFAQNNSSSFSTQYHGMNALFGNAFLFVCGFGTLLIGLGLFNLIASQKYIKDDQVITSIGVVLLIQAFFSYMIFDVISLILGMSAAVILLAKNKSIRLNSQTG